MKRTGDNRKNVVWLVIVWIIGLLIALGIVNRYKIVSNIYSIDEVKNNVATMADYLDVNFNTNIDENIIVKEVSKPKVNPYSKLIAITFDDGPHGTNTYQILEILKKYNAKATFFMLGQNVAAYPDVVRAVAESGSEIAMHSWDHPNLTKCTSTQISEQFEATSNAIFNITGQRPTLIRPPYGSVNDTVKQTLNYPFILWNIDSLDWKSRDPDQIVPLVLGDAEDGDIILMHDIHDTTVPAAERVIKKLTEDGYIFVTVSELMDARDVNSKMVYYGKWD